MKCKFCGKSTLYSYSGACQGCYNYYKNGGTNNATPDSGTIAYDSRGFVVCHICGRAYKRLGSHVKESHNMTIAEYKERFGLCNCSKTTESTYSGHMKSLAYKNNMPQRLIKTGANTRIKKGERDKRFGKKVRLQERINKSKAHSEKVLDENKHSDTVDAV